tara:strand:- start:523 stop:1458 length:936 start_codon:yes stop_codon:yes gene_type:complete
MVQRYLKYTISTDDVERKSYINLAKDLSAINRQLFRQARMYKVKSIQVIDDDEAKFIQFGMAPNTWAMSNAVKRAFRRWNEMNAQVLQDQPSLKARWNDFKPYLSYNHLRAEAGTAQSYMLETPEDINGANVQYGEWKYSMFESPDGTSSVDGYQVGILGGHEGETGAYDYVGLIKSYGDARGTVNQQEPNVNVNAASDDPLVNLLDAGSQFDEIAENIIQEGDRPPYALGNAAGEDYVGSSNNMPDPLMFAECNPSGAVDGRQKIYNVDVPLGVIRIDHSTEQNTGGTTFTVIIEVAEGKYKGIHSESMV